MNLFVAALRSAWAWPVACDALEASAFALTASLKIVCWTSVAEAVLASSCLRSLAADRRLEMSAQTDPPLLVVEPAAVVLLLDVCYSRAAVAPAAGEKRRDQARRCDCYEKPLRHGVFLSGWGWPDGVAVRNPFSLVDSGPPANVERPSHPRLRRSRGGLKPSCAATKNPRSRRPGAAADAAARATRYLRTNTWQASRLTRRTRARYSCSPHRVRVGRCPGRRPRKQVAGRGDEAIEGSPLVRPSHAETERVKGSGKKGRHRPQRAMKDRRRPDLPVDSGYSGRGASCAGLGIGPGRHGFRAGRGQSERPRYGRCRPGPLRPPYLAPEGRVRHISAQGKRRVVSGPRPGHCVKALARRPRVPIVPDAGRAAWARSGRTRGA